MSVLDNIISNGEGGGTQIQHNARKQNQLPGVKNTEKLNVSRNLKVRNAELLVKRLAHQNQNYY